MTEQNISQKYALPYPNPALDNFLQVAENAFHQAQANAHACRVALTHTENTVTDVLPFVPGQEEDFTTSLVYSSRSLMLSGESALQAQNSLCESLAAASKAASDEKDKLLEDMATLNQELTELDTQTAELRQAFTKVTDQPDMDESYATVEAKKLLDALEQAYQKHEQNRQLHQKISQAEENIQYLTQAAEEAAQELTQIEDLARRTKEEWKTVLETCHIDPSQVENQTDLTEIFGQAQPEQPPQEEPVQEAPPVEQEEIVETTSPWAVIWSYLKIILVAFLIAFVLRAYVFDITKVDGTSMSPTLADNDTLITSKITGGTQGLRRGDIVVLNAPDVPGEDYIKRIIGLPNEEIIITQGNVYINGELLIEPYLDNVVTEGDINMIIPDGYYFVMGDNRGSSRDSREEDIGLISVDDINGHALFRIFPLKTFGSLY